MSANDIKQIRKRLDDLEVASKALAQNMSDTVAKVSEHSNNTNDTQSSFKKQIEDSIGLTMSSSLDAAKTRIQEELKAYVDEEIAKVAKEFTDKLTLFQADVDNVKANLVVVSEANIATQLAVEAIKSAATSADTDVLASTSDEEKKSP